MSVFNTKTIHVFAVLVWGVFNDWIVFTAVNVLASAIIMTISHYCCLYTICLLCTKCFQCFAKDFFFFSHIEISAPNTKCSFKTRLEGRGKKSPNKTENQLNISE